MLAMGPVVGEGSEQPAGPCIRHHRVVHFPVLIAYRRWLRSGVIEKHVTRRSFSSAFEIVALIDSVESGLDDAGIASGLDLFLQRIAFGTSGDIDERRQPVKSGESSRS